MPIISAFPTGESTVDYTGPKSSLPSLEEGKIGYVTDEKRLYTGNTDGTNTQIPNADDLSAHISNRENPHGVTAAQVGALPLTVGTLTGNLTGKYISGTWLQATEDNHMENTSAKVAVLDGSGWVYYRTVSEMFADLNISGVVKTALDKAKAYTDSAIGDAIAASY